MKVVAPNAAAAAALPRKLRKRERAAMAVTFAMAQKARAFSIAYDIKPKVVRSIIYFHQPSRAVQEVELEPEGDDEEEDDGVDSGDFLAALASAGAANKEQQTAKKSASKPKPSPKASGSSGKPALPTPGRTDTAP